MAATAAVATPLELRGDAGFHDAWPQLRALADPSGALTVEQARARLSEFAAPNTPRANFGVRRDALWLHLPVRVAADGGGDWVLSVEYPSLDRVDVYLFAGERLLQAHPLGRVMPQAGHRLPGRAHALQLRLAPAQSYDLLLRVQTQSTAIVPVYLIRTAQYLEREAQVQLVQGLLAGVGLCLIVYSLAQWLTLRERMFLDYAGMVFGMTAFFFTLNGLGPQHLWPDSAAPTTRVLLVSLLLAVAAGSLFVERALSLHEVSRRLVRVLRLTAAVASVVAVAFLAGAIDYRTAQGAASLLGSLPMALALPAAITRARRGDRAAAWMVVGWVVFLGGILTMTGVIRGWLPANAWTLNALQGTSVIESAVWMAVLGMRMHELRAAAQRVQTEREALLRMAHTDALTGLPNRRALAAALQDALRAAVPGRTVGVYLLDLDGFKPINDRFGHETGDALLVAAARRLREQVRSSDVVARLGGDEFVVMADGLADDADAQRLGSKLLETFAAPFVIDGRPHRVGVTVGYALAPADGRDLAGLLRRADAAMYEGKQAGGNRLRRGGVVTAAAATA